MEYGISSVNSVPAPVAPREGVGAGGRADQAKVAGVAEAPQKPRVAADLAPELQFDPQTMMRDLDKAVQNMNEMMSHGRSQLSFTIDPTLNRTVVRVTDRETGEVIRELPPESMLRVARSIEDLKGVLFSEQI